MFQLPRIYKDWSDVTNSFLPGVILKWDNEGSTEWKSLDEEIQLVHEALSRNNNQFPVTVGGERILNTTSR